MNSTNNISARDTYEHAKKILFDAWIENFMQANPTNMGKATAMCWAWVNNRKLTQSEIRLETTLSAINNTFTFGVTPNQASSSGVVFNTENRLQLQDSMVVSEMGIFVAKPASATSTAFRLRSYGNTQDFTAGAAAAIDSTLYDNGAFSLKVNNDVVLPYRGLFNHHYLPQTQQTAALGAASPGDQIRGAEDGFITVEPNILLQGSKNNQPIIQTIDNLATVDAFSRVIIIFRGVLAQNSTVVN